MDERGVLTVLTKLDVDYRYTTSDGWAMAGCPLAPYRLEHRKGEDARPSFGVHIDEDDVSRYNCFTCKSKGTLGGLAMLLGKYREEPELIEYGKQVDHDDILGGGAMYEWEDDRRIKGKASYRNKTFPSERNFEDRFPRTIAVPRANAYLRGRRIPSHTAFSLGLRFDPKQQRVLFPVYDYWTGRYAGCSGRSILSSETLARIEDATGKPQPKVRDYQGLEKDNVLLGRARSVYSDKRLRLRRNIHSAITAPNGGITEQIRHNQRSQSYGIGVEGLFAFARLCGHGFADVSFALLGSRLLPGKMEIIANVGLPVFWFTDNDPAGQSCLYGQWDESAEQYRGGGALQQLYHSVAQFVPDWPEGKEDPDDLTKDELLRMIDDAELYVP